MWVFILEDNEEESDKESKTEEDGDKAARIEDKGGGGSSGVGRFSLASPRPAGPAGELLNGDFRDLLKCAEEYKLPQGMPTDPVSTIHNLSRGSATPF